MLECLKQYPDNYFDSCITDPPYGLDFMGKNWDHGVPGVIYWEEVLRVLKPGATLLAFGGTRTFHRLTVAIEDAGFEIRDCIMYVYGSGFPKSTDISKQIDKANGEAGRLYKFTEWMRSTGLTAKEINDATDTFMGSHYLTDKSQPAIPTTELWVVLRPICGDVPPWVDDLIKRIEAERDVVGSNSRKAGWFTAQDGHDITIPATEAAKTWDGFGTSLKPAHEPILVCMKPRDGTFSNNAQVHGVAGFNIDAARIEADGDKTGGNGNWGFSESRGWNSNEVPARSDVEQSTTRGRFPANLVHDGSDEVMALFPETKSGTKLPHHKRNSMASDGTTMGKMKGLHSQFEPGSEGSAARFFYCSKSGTNERHAGLDDFYWRRDKTAPSGFVRIERDEWQSLGEGDRAQGNIHSTVKPVDLCRWLAVLTSTQYVEIARARLHHWSGEKALDEFINGKPAPADSGPWFGMNQNEE
jgi:site-specific DNA-methyltransferase (adenine-specific)